MATPVFVEVKVSYVYASGETWKMYTQSCDELGWHKKALLTQLLHSYGCFALAYYQEAAEMDALARGFSSHRGEHYRTLRDWVEMPRYVTSQPPFKPSPLADIHSIEANTASRRAFSSIRCSGRNSAILHLATIIERSNIPQTLSRIMLWYFDRYWNNRYVLQLESDQQETISPHI